jgi:hypothetical protein
MKREMAEYEKLRDEIKALQLEVDQTSPIEQEKSDL